MLKLYEDLYNELISNEGAIEAAIDVDVTVHDEAIMHDLKKLSALVVKWGLLAVVAEDKFKGQSLHVKNTLWPEAKAAARAALTARGEKITVDSVDGEAKLNNLYQIGKSVLQKKETAMAAIKKVESAMWAKKDMLQSVNARQARELDVIPAGS